ncbi:MAG: dihydrolipoamide acetyltransferase family protein [Acidimicrobiales bacterium]
MADVTMPQLGETVTEGTITRWFKQVGDQVAADEVLFEVSTDKVDSEVPSPASGYLAEIVVAEGGTVEVGATLAVISDSPAAEGTGEEAGSAAGGEEASADAKPQEDGEEAPIVPDSSGGGEGRSVEAVEAPAPEPEPAPPPEPQADTGPRSSGGPTGGTRDGQAPSPPSAPRGTGSKRLLSPVVRRLVADHQLDPDAIEGTGAGGRITRNDVQSVIDAGRGRAPSPTTAQPSRPPTPAAPPVVATDDGTGDEVVAFSNIRRRTAEHMVRSKATSAHTLVVVEVDYEGVDRVRLAQKERFKAEEGVNLTYLPFVSRAVVDALREFPHMNASVGDDQLVVHRAVHLGIAVDIHFEGLMVPVVHAAGDKRLRVLAREISALAALARSRKLGPDDIAGGTFTITNPGPFATLITGAIINQPQVAILSTDGVRKRPVVVELPDSSDAIAVHPMGNLALTFDHRAVDGAYASAFAARIKDVLQTRDWAAELA